MSISDLFLKVKNLCYEISELDENEPISEARMRRHIIRCLRKEFIPFISSVQGWTTQPSIIELENLLSNKEALMRQMSGKHRSEDVLFIKEKNKTVQCYKCGKPNHVAKFCRTKPEDWLECTRYGRQGHNQQRCFAKLGDEKANAVHEKQEDNPKWEQFFSIEVAGFSHHATGMHLYSRQFVDMMKDELLLLLINQCIQW